MRQVTRWSAVSLLLVGFAVALFFAAAPSAQPFDELRIAPGSVEGQQAPPAGQKAPTFRGNTQIVSVDVIVRDSSGAVVRGLTAADFEILA